VDASVDKRKCKIGRPQPVNLSDRLNVCITRHLAQHRNVLRVGHSEPHADITGSARRKYVTDLKIKQRACIWIAVSATTAIRIHTLPTLATQTVSQELLSHKSAHRTFNVLPDTPEECLCRAAFVRGKEPAICVCVDEIVLNVRGSFSEVLESGDALVARGSFSEEP
jgi:hypothetical protein